MKDWNVDLVRHFLLAGANQLRNQPLITAMTAWEYQGPGVWTGIDETKLVNQTLLFSKAVEVAEKMGNEIPLDYLNQNVQTSGTRWLKPQSTPDVVALIRELERHLNPRAESPPC